MIYLDNAATSFYKPQKVKNTIVNAINLYTANPGRSGHRPSRIIAEEIFNTREVLKDFFNAKNYELIFTKNCTEALNLAIFGSLKQGDHVITTCYEHNSVLRPLEYLKSKGVEVTILSCFLKNFSKSLEKHIKSNTKLVITTMVSNVTGEICDVKEVSKICKKYKIKYLIDGAQSSGHMVVNLDDIDADFYAFAGHKGLFSITGVGGLFVKNLSNLKPLLYGGTGTNSAMLVQPKGEIESYEAGTISSISILSLKSGVEFLSNNVEHIVTKEQNLTMYLLNSLKKLSFVEIYSKDDCVNVVSFNIKNIDSMTVANMLDEKFNICVRGGLHCAPLIHKQLNTLNSGAIRVSLGYKNSEKDIDNLIYALTKIAKA